MQKAKAAIFMGANRPFELKEYELTPPAPGMVQLELAASGVCGTDLHFHSGRLAIDPPKIIGHEFVGKVTQIAEEDAKKYGIQKGDYAISDIACPCGECGLCSEGDDANCVNMQVTNGGDPDQPPHFHGGYGEYSYAPAENLIRLPAGVDPVAAGVFACPGPTALHAFSLAEKAGNSMDKIKTAVVQGIGPVGVFAAAYLAAMGVPNIFTLSHRRNEEKEKRIRPFGVTEMLYLEEMTPEEIENRIKKASPLGADLVFEASGNPQAIPLGMQLLRNRGIYLVPGQYSDSGAVEIHPEVITFKALQILGSSQYSFRDVEAYTEFLRENPELQPMIRELAACYKLDEVNQAFADAKQGKNIKTLLIK